MTTDTMTRTGFAPVRAGTDEALELVMQELWLTGRVLPVGAALEVRHLFKCGQTQPVEAVYAFMLPRDATLRRFRVIGENFSVQSDLRRTAEALREYERAMEQGHLSALARHYRDGVVNLNLGNLRPGDTAIVVLEILAGVETRDDGIRFRFPFALAPAYHSRARFVESEPGVGEMELPEAEFGDVLLPQWVKDARGLHRVGFHLDMALGQPVAEVASPSHSIRVTQKDGGIWRVALAPQADVPNRDLVLDARTLNPLSAVFGGVATDGRGHFIAVVPSTQFGKATGAPCQIVFVIDRSGSMNGAPLQQAVCAVEACLGALSATDRFGLVAFDDQAEVFRPDKILKPKLSEAEQKHRKAAQKFLDRLDARGGTELAAGIHAACDLLSEGGGDIFVVTDGQGSGTEDILRAARKCCVRLHCLGIGSASQDRFLTLLARETGGVSRFVTPRERVDAAALELFASVARPVATEVTVHPPNNGRVRIEPTPATTVFDGTPLVVYGQTDTADATALLISWQRNAERATLELPLRWQPGGDAETARLLRGARLITDAESRITAAPGSETKNELQALEKLSRAYGLASRAMSLVAVVKRPGDRPGAPPKTSVVPVGMPEDTAFEAYFDQRFAGTVSYSRLPYPGMDSPAANMRACAAARMVNAPASPDAAELMASAQTQRRAASATQSMDLALKLAASIQPDGGLPGNDDEERLLRTIVAAAFMLALEAEAGPMFRLHLARLLAYLKSLVGGLAGTRRALVERVIHLAERRIALEGDWFAEAEALVAGRDTKPEALWRKLEQACTPAP